MAKDKKLTKKERLFCQYCFKFRNEREAAARAGYFVLPERAAMKLLERREIQREIGRLVKSQAAFSQEQVMAGYRRIAFGSVADAVKLIFQNGQPLTAEAIEQLDLFPISEIKCPRSGGLEIKFFDRLKALEKLAALSEQESYDTALPFYQALERGAGKLTQDMEAAL